MNDIYLDIPMGEALQLSKGIKPSVVSLFDDWENLIKILHNKQQISFVDLDRLASILKAISNELNPA